MVRENMKLITKDMSVDEKLKVLGIKRLSVDELAKVVAEKLRG